MSVTEGGIAEGNTGRRSINPSVFSDGQGSDSQKLDGRSNNRSLGGSWIDLEMVVNCNNALNMEVRDVPEQQEQLRCCCSHLSV